MVLKSCFMYLSILTWHVFHNKPTHTQMQGNYYGVFMYFAFTFMVYCLCVCRPETIKSALDVITVLTVTPKSQLLLLNNINMPDNVSTPAMRFDFLSWYGYFLIFIYFYLFLELLEGIPFTHVLIWGFLVNVLFLNFLFSVLTGLAEGEVLADAEVQKAALNVLINCVCGPIERVSTFVDHRVATYLLVCRCAVKV